MEVEGNSLELIRDDCLKEIQNTMHICIYIIFQYFGRVKYHSRDNEDDAVNDNINRSAITKSHQLILLTKLIFVDHFLTSMPCAE